tara:strand:+ start:1962 stop:2069 length:108 start_codon:yes stop_codon:yes gene_type:complete
MGNLQGLSISNQKKIVHLQANDLINSMGKKYGKHK